MFVRTEPGIDPPADRRLWEQRGRHDSYEPLPRVRQVCRDLAPGARVRRHLWWRYSIVWRKPSA